MVHFVLQKGRKGPNDKLVLVYAYGEVLSFSEILYLLSKYFESEDSYYPINEGYQGKAMLLKAIIDVYSCIPLERVLRYYRLERKKKPVEVIERLHEPL
jgi:hypothetical protein